MALSREGLRQFIESELGVSVANIADETPLFSGGVINSHMLLSVISYVETESGKRVGAGDLESFDSIANMLRFAGASGAPTP